MKELLRVTIPGCPPSVNHCYITRRGTGQRILSKVGRAYLDTATWYTKYARSAIGWPSEWPDQMVVEVSYYFPDRRRRDTHNLFKCVADGLAVGMGVDDQRFLYREEARSVDKEYPRVEIVVKERSDD